MAEKKVKKTNDLSKVEWELLLINIIAIIVGVLFIAFPGTMRPILCYIIAGLLTALGIVAVVRFFVSKSATIGNGFVIGAVAIVFGVFGFIYQEELGGLLTLIIGFFIFIEGLLNMQKAIVLKKSQSKIADFVVMLIFAIVQIAMGIMIILVGDVNWLVIFAGISLCVDGVLGIIVTFVYGKKIKASHLNLINSAKNLTKSTSQDNK